MASEAIDLFYSYAHEDEALRDRLNTHLSLLRQQGFIYAWYDRDISAGSLWAQEIDTHLQTARIILLLVSPDFMTSSYCYGVEMKEALRRHEAGEATVIPIILRPCDWEAAPFGKLQALPKDGKAVTMWANRDAALTNIAKGIRKVVDEINGSSPTTSPQSTTGRKKAANSGGGLGGQVMQNAPTLSTPVLKKAIDTYYKGLAEYKGKADYELALRSAFQNLLADMARHVKWTLIPEQTIEGGIRPDGVLRDAFNLKRGYWEAKGPKSDLEREIVKKTADGYPLINTIFENTRTAVLYQSKRRVPTEYDLQNPNHVSDLLKQFFTFVEPDIENFEVAVDEFKVRIPELAGALVGIIDKEHTLNKKFNTAFDTFMELCRAALDPQISAATINEMLVQHLLTKRLFRTVFGNSEFINRNVIAVEIEKVIRALTSRSFNADDFLKTLDRFYVAIEGAAKGIESWSERQHFLNTVYERFFQGFSVKQADTHGIVYTPQEIVDFMCNSVDEILKRDFGKSIAEPGVQILDPATGTGNFIVNLMQHHIPRSRLKYKYMHDLFCNEITLLPYYIASLNIEHEYYERMKEYESFEGICFADTLELAEGKQLPLFVEENTERVQREKDAQIMVVIGNPPYNMGQKNENENNKNRPYPVIDGRIHETYAKASSATLTNKLYDAYVRFFRWATDRLGDRDGIVCLVTNNSFVDQIAFDSMRKHLMKDFTQVYHLDLHGNVRKNPKLSGTTHNVFGIQVGVGITIAVRSSNHSTSILNYYRVPEYWTRLEKLKFLASKTNITEIEWQELYPDERHTWLTGGLQADFTAFLPMGTKLTKSAKEANVEAIFKIYSLGVVTSRDAYVYSFDAIQLRHQVAIFVDIYNSAVDKLKRQGRTIDLASLVDISNPHVKWTRQVKSSLLRLQYSQYNDEHIRNSLYRPFVKKKLYFDDFWNEERYKQHLIFPTYATEMENVAIVTSDHGHRAPFSTLCTNIIPELHLLASTDAVQCFSYYIYAGDGTNRHENITDWSLSQFQAKYGLAVSKWDIFHYVYAMLHHPQYRERYAENLKRDLPHIPLLHGVEAFQVCVRVGRELMDLHLNYEQAQEYKLEWLENEDVPFSWRVEKMKLTADRSALVINESLTLAGIPSACFEYRLGNRSALEWVIDQYQVSKDARSGIVSDPNNLDAEEYIVRLVGRVVTVSVETVRLVGDLAHAVTMKDWMDVGVDLNDGV
ncbi:MAG: TIR domain-containing protein [Ktedonobacteraceae bacterium]|nr:TIR domain-containing protein [Ktedonobacteraceae bacterium]